MFPKNEQYGITSQLRRATSSVPTNLAEGSNRGSDKEFKRYIYIGLGSISEVEYLISLSLKLEYIDKRKFFELNRDIIEIRKMLSGLLRRVKERI